MAGDGGFNGVEHVGDNYDGGSGGETEGDLIDFGGISGSIVVDQDAGTVTKTYQVEKYVWADGGGTEAREFDLLFSELNGVPNLRPKDIAEALDADLINSGDDAERDFSRIDGEVADLITTVTETVTVTDTIANFERIAGTRGDDFFYATAAADDFDAGDQEPDPDLPPEEQEVPAADTLSFENSTTGIAADLVNQGFSGGFAQGGSYSGFSNVIGTNFDDVVVGDDGANFIDVKDGTNSVTAGAGDDTVYSFDGVQVIDLGDGDDIMQGGFINSPTGISVSVYGRDGDDDIFAFGNELLLDGGEGNDTLYGVGLDSTDTDNKLIVGGAGDDLVRIEGIGIDAQGGAGNDTLWVFNGNSGPLAVDLQNQLITGGSSVGSNISGFENITGQGDSLTQQGSLTGTDGDNVIRSEFGGFQMFGLAGNDTLIGNDQDDVFDGGDDTDTAVFAGAERVFVNLINGTASGQGTDTLAGIENIVGSVGVDLLEGDSNNNVLDSGDSGGDVMYGYGGDDTLILRQHGQAIGDDGNDRIEISEGFELGYTAVEGGLDTDTLIIASDIDLTIDLSGRNQTAGDGTAFFQVSTVENLTTGNGNNTITGQSGASIINTGDGDDVIRGDAGDELISLRLNIDGSNGRYGRVDNLDMPSEAMTIEMLYTGETNGPSTAIGQAFFSYFAGGNDNEILIYAYENGSSESAGDNIEISVSGTRIVTDIPTSRLTDGETHRLSVTFQAANGSVPGRIELYIDGERLFVEEAQFDPIATGGILTLGQEQDAPGGNFNNNQDLRGRVTDIRIFDDVRTAAEIAQNAGYPIADPMAEGGLLHNWAPDAVSDLRPDIPNLAGGPDMVSFAPHDSGQQRSAGSTGDDTINAGGGDDWVDGGGGADALDGGEGDDTLSYESSRGGVTLDLVNNVFVGGSAAGDTVTGFEHIIGSNFDDIIVNDGNLTSMTGLFGDDALLGAALDETIDAGAGDDYVLGGAGADTLIGGLGVDTLGYSTSDAAVSIDLANSTASGGHAEGDTISSFENIIGSGYDDFLFGNAVANNLSGGVGNDELRGGAGDDVLDGGDGSDRLNGGLGNDIMNGGAGNDIYIVDSEGDVITELAGGGDDIVYATFNYELPVNVEVLIVLGERAFEATGSSERNFLFGGDKDDIINGAGGADYMEGGKGNDTYAVDESSDAIVERAGEGYDNVYSSIDYIIGEDQEIESALLTGNAVILRGSNSDNQLIGNNNVNVIDGRGGSDYLLGLGGNDIFQITPDEGAVDVIGDFLNGAPGEGDRIAFAGFDAATTTIVRVSQTSFEVRDDKGTSDTADDTVQQFILNDGIGNSDYTGGDLVEGDDYYFS